MSNTGEKWQEKAAVVLDTSHPMYQLILQQYTQIANEDGQYYEYMYWCQQMMSMKLHSPHALFVLTQGPFLLLKALNSIRLQTEIPA